MRTFIFSLLLVPLASFSQKVENTKAEAAGEKIIITYDLTQGEPGDNYTISIFSSHNNFSTPISKVIGDVGQNVKEGKGKRIEWASKAELGKYKGPLTFEIEVKVLAPFTLKSELSSAKRGKTLSLRWRGGDQAQDVKIELLKAGAVEGTLATTKNNGSYAWAVPSKQKTGKDYSLRLVNGKETASSSAFVIQPKIPLWAKIAVPVAVGGVVILLLPEKCKCGGEQDKLVAPPDMNLD